MLGLPGWFDAYFAVGDDLLMNELLPDGWPLLVAVYRLGNGVHGD
ncbi:hypothetical protein BN903_54 [Halorubrum sp. AJ67]|nr:hypothetical protein BN903_54 [Halorubrum sp. AJ67]